MKLVNSTVEIREKNALYFSYTKDSAFNKPQITTGMRCRLDLGEGGALVVLCCKKLPQLWEIVLFIREMNGPVMAIRRKTFHN